ncbi:hypothetical protein [Tritonibacter mobilis]|uniref:hypothetical protein n=1 Tax=Tritonibacter mobilis TaxID=379347 RepID=UPI000806E2E2|nr:hypothetical protein [Tritonibacter mobilis]
MWREFEVPPTADAIREAAKKALPEVLEKTGLKKTKLSVRLFDCPSALTRFLNGGKFEHERLRILVEGFDDYLGVVNDAEDSAGTTV